MVVGIFSCPLTISAKSDSFAKVQLNQIKNSAKPDENSAKPDEFTLQCNTYRNFKTREGT